MELVKKTNNYSIYKKKTGRYAIKNKEKKYIVDKEKIDILLKENLIKLSPKKKPENTPVAEAPVAEASVAEAPVAEAPVAEAPVAEAPVAEAPVAEK